MKSEMPLRQNTGKVEEMFDFAKSAMNSKNRSRESQARRPLPAQNPRCHFRSRGNCLAWEGLGAMAAFGWRHVGRSRPAQASKGLVAICPRPLWGSYHPKPPKHTRPEKKGAVVKMGPISRKPALPPVAKDRLKGAVRNPEKTHTSQKPLTVLRPTTSPYLRGLLGPCGARARRGGLLQLPPPPLLLQLSL